MGIQLSTTIREWKEQKGYTPRIRVHKGNVVNRSKLTERLIRACSQGDIATVDNFITSWKKVVNKGPRFSDINMYLMFDLHSSNCISPLSAACIHGHLDVVKSLITKAKVNVRRDRVMYDMNTTLGPFLFDILVNNEYYDIVKYLVTYSNIEIDEHSIFQLLSEQQIDSHGYTDRWSPITDLNNKRVRLFKWMAVTQRFQLIEYSKHDCRSKHPVCLSYLANPVAVSQHWRQEARNRNINMDFVTYLLVRDGYVTVNSTTNRHKTKSIRKYLKILNGLNEDCVRYILTIRYSDSSLIWW